jgi:1-deoxy-D-xylulose-5-phosphate reductoisomerase
MVIAGEAVRAAARESGAEILPVDSEHSAIFQCLHAGRREEVRRLLLTASGGPFRGYDRARLAGVTRLGTLAHPTWQMGAKITVDSATLMNKGFEVIEAVRLFDIPAEQVEVVVHPESIIHSAVEYIDNTVIAEMSVPDMRACVQYAMTYPARRPACIPPLDLFTLGRLTFHRPDPEAFPALTLAHRALALGGAAPAILNAADEVAVAAFLREEISFLEISELLGEALLRVDCDAKDLPALLERDREARAVTEALIKHKGKGHV